VAALGDVLGLDAKDAAFIKHARTDVPDLVAEVRRLQQALAEEREACAQLAERHISGLARLGGGLHDADRRRLEARGEEIAAAIRAR
jgi:hypothetical protein